jgi:hypothetical protein
VIIATDYLGGENCPVFLNGFVGNLTILQGGLEKSNILYLYIRLFEF